MAQVKRKSLPEESITVEGGPMPQIDPRQMYPVPPQIQPTQAPVSNDAMLLERVKQLRGQAPQPDVARPSQVMYPMDRSAGMQADQMQAQIGVKPDPFAGMSGLKRMLAQGLLGAAEGSIHAQDPGGYNGWRQRQDQIEQQATNSQLEQVRSLRNEQLQRERLYQDELQNQQLREQQQYQFGEEQKYRDEDLKLKKAQELRLSKQGYTLGPQQQHYEDGEMVAQNTNVPTRAAGDPNWYPFEENGKLYRVFYDQDPTRPTGRVLVGQATPKAQPGAKVPITDQRGQVTSMFDTETGAITPVKVDPNAGPAFRGAMTMDRQRTEIAAQSGLRAIAKFRQEMQKNPNLLRDLAIPGSPGARLALAARGEMADVLTRIRTGAALNAYEQQFYNGQAPGLLDQLFADPATVEYKLSIFEDNFRALAPPQAQTEAPPNPSGRKVVPFGNLKP